MNQIPGKIAARMPTVASLSAGNDNELRDWLPLLNRRKIMIVATGLLAMAVTALIVAQMTPLYKASSRVMLDVRKFKLVATEAAPSGVDAGNLGAVNTELEIIKSEDLLGRVVDKLGLVANPDFNGTKTPDFLTEALAPVRDLWSMAVATVMPPQRNAAPAPRPVAENNDPRRQAAIGTIASRLATTILGRTYIILTTVETPNGALSAQIANTIADFYLVDQLDAKYGANKRATEWLEERLRDLRRNLQTADDAVALYRHDKGLAGSPEGAASSQTLADLIMASVNPAELANIAEVSANGTLAALRMQDVELSRRLSELSDKYGENHPRMVQARSELSSVRGRMSAETSRVAVAVRAELEAARSEEEQLKQQVDKASVISGEASQFEAEAKQLEREAQSNRAIYESFMARFKELREQQDI
jgi:succinoglycan biosynthesis transport protein ExoP